MSIYDKKITDRFMDLRKFMNVQLKVNEKGEIVQKTLQDVKPKLENILSYMKSVRVDLDTNQELFDFLRDLCRPVFWELRGHYKSTSSQAVEWALIVCQEHSLEQTAWNLYWDLPERSQVLAWPYLPEHLRSAARIAQ